MDVVRPIWEALCADTVSTLTEIKNLRVAENDCWVFMWLSDSDCIWSAPVSTSQHSSSYLFPADGLEQWALLRAHEVTIFALSMLYLKIEFLFLRQRQIILMIFFCHCRMPGFYNLFLWLTESLNPCLNMKNWPVAPWVWAIRRKNE